MKELSQKCFVEFIGTFYLVLTVLCVVLLGGVGVIPASAIGFVLMVMVYAGGGISGGHYNPAVSFAAAVRGVLPFKNLIPYWISQVFGAMIAGVVAMKFVPYLETAPVVNFDLVNLFIAEFLFTFALCYVVLMVATTQAAKGNSYYGLAIGMTVTVGIFAVGSICLAAFNPAVALGIYMMNIVGGKIIFITLIANLLAGAAAAGVFKLVVDEA